MGSNIGDGCSKTQAIFPSLSDSRNDQLAATTGAAQTGGF